MTIVINEWSIFKESYPRINKIYNKNKIPIL